MCLEFPHFRCICRYLRLNAGNIRHCNAWRYAYETSHGGENAQKDEVVVRLVRARRQDGEVMRLTLFDRRPYQVRIFLRPSLIAGGHTFLMAPILTRPRTRDAIGEETSLRIHDRRATKMCDNGNGRGAFDKQYCNR